tara:strand:- start:585 stop:767 length:183 start_codon:yes stop_codon:yes gene_type:complete
MKVNELIKEIDYEVIAREPAMDDYDAGVIEGLKIAREIVNNSPVQTDSNDNNDRYHLRVM